MSALNAQLGSAEETTFGTFVAPSRFDEFTSESIAGSYTRIESNGLRAGRLYRSDDRFTTYFEGASGDLEMEVGSKNFGFWLRQMLGGTPTTTGTATGFTHTFTPGTLAGRSFSAQVFRPFYTGVNGTAWNYGGGKVTEWELANSNDDNLMATLSCDFATEATTGTPAVASYPTGLQTFNWVGGSVTIGGTAFDVMEASVSGSNSLKVDRRYLRNSATKKEQIGEDYRSGEFSLTADFDSLTQRDRVAAATAAGTLATTVLKWEAPTVIPGGSIKPSLTVTINARFDAFEANVGGPDAVTQEITGMYLGASALSIAYVTADATTLV